MLERGYGAMEFAEWLVGHEGLDDLLDEMVESYGDRAEDFADELCNIFEDEFGCSLGYEAGVEKIVFMREDWSEVVKLQVNSIGSDDITESEVWADAKASGLSRFFVESVRIGGHPDWGWSVWVQERVESGRFHGFVERDHLSRSLRGVMKRNGWNNWNNSTDFIKEVALRYPVGVAEELMRFCRKWDLNDMHRSNFVVTKRGEVVAFDFTPMSHMES